MSKQLSAHFGRRFQPISPAQQTFRIFDAPGGRSVCPESGMPIPIRAISSTAFWSVNCSQRVALRAAL
jgi:hypothetical protein